jgi:hypothetical protein
MTKPKVRQQKVIVRAFDIILTFESDKLDDVLEAETFEVIKKINELLQKQFITELPQLDFDNQKGKKKIKIGIIPINDELEDE